jgi:hypothetical protein
MYRTSALDGAVDNSDKYSIKLAIAQLQLEKLPESPQETFLRRYFQLVVPIRRSVGKVHFHGRSPGNYGFAQRFRQPGVFSQQNGHRLPFNLNHFAVKHRD